MSETFYNSDIEFNMRGGFLQRVKIVLNLNGYKDRFKKAQFALDTQIMNDVEPYMPIRENTLRSLTRAESTSLAGKGKVCVSAGAYGRFQYEGKVMVDPITGSPWARKDAKKVLTDRPLTYSNPMTTPHWFETAKQDHEKEWVQLVERYVNGGK